MRAVILNFTADRKNWGCQATSIGLYRFVSHVLKPHGFSQIETVLFPHSHIKDFWQQKIYGTQIREVFSAKDPSVQQLKMLEELCQSRFGYHVDKVKNADLVFFQGEGTMGPSKFYETCRVFALPYLARKLWNKPVISINQSFVVNNQIDLAAAVNIFNSFNLNVFRETKSWGVAKDNAILHAILCPDFAFVDAADGIKKPVLKADKKYFCVTGSAGLGEYDLGGYVSSIEALHVETGLVPACIYSRKSDRKLVQLLQGRLGEKNVKVISQSAYKSHAQILPVLAQAAFTIGGRYHTAISSLSMKTPVILTAGNSHKNEGLGDLLGMNLPVMQPDDKSGIVRQVKSYIENKGQTLSALEAGLKGILNTQAVFAEYLNDNIPKVLENRQAQTAMPTRKAAKELVSLPSINLPAESNAQFSRLRTQFDLSANLSQSKWSVQSG